MTAIDDGRRAAPVSSPLISRNAAIDGLRAFFAMLIVASHCGILGQGGVGNNFFFCLAGFMAAQPFKENPEEGFLGSRGVFRYYRGRFLRVVVPFWIILIMVKACTGARYFTLRSLIENMLFVKMYAHLWFLQNLMVMYLLLPFIMKVLWHVGRLLGHEDGRWANIALLVILSVLTRRYLTTDVLQLSQSQPLWIWAFTTGMAFGYLVRPGVAGDKGLKRKERLGSVTNIVVPLVLALAVLTSHSVLALVDPALDGFLVGWQAPVPVCLACGVAIALVAICPDCAASRALGVSPLALLGRIGMDVYLIHPFTFSIVPFEEGPRKFIAVLLVSVALALAVYELIERPIAIFAKGKGVDGLRRHYDGL